MEELRWDSAELKKGIDAIYNGEEDSALAAFDNTQQARCAIHKGEALIMGAFLTQKNESLKACVDVFNGAYKVAISRKKSLMKKHERGTTDEDLRMVAEARLLEVESMFFLSLSQLTTHSYLKGFMNLNSTYGLAKSLFSDFKDHEDRLGEELSDLIGFTIGCFWLYLSLLPEIIGPSASKVLSWVTGLQGDREEGLMLLNRVANGQSYRKPLAIIFLAAKFLYLGDIDFPRKNESSLVLNDTLIAIDLVNSALDIWPDGPFFLFLSSYAKMTTGRAVEAQPILKKLSEKHVSRILWMNWGHSHLFSGDWNTAVDIYHEIGTKEDISDIYIAVICEGMCHVMKGDLESGKERMKRAGEIAAKGSQNKEFKRLADRYSDDSHRYELSFFEWKGFLRAHGSDELEESLLDRLEAIKEKNGLMIEQSQTSGSSWFGLKSSHKNTAVDDMKVSYLYSRALALDHLKRHEEALACYEELLLLTPETHHQKFAFWFGAFHCAQLCYYLGHHKRAVELLEQIKGNANNHRLVYSAKVALQRIEAGEIAIDK